MRQYHIVSTVIAALTLMAIFIWQGAVWLASERQVDRVVAIERFGGDPQESIRALCLASGERVMAASPEVRRQLETGSRRLVVRMPQGDVEVLIVEGPTGPHFRTKSDSVTENNLLNLPDC